MAPDEIERIMGEDPDDRAIREAHGFTWEDDWQDGSLLCRNGCGLTYPDISSGKIRKCSASRAKPLSYAARCARYARQRGWHYGPQLTSIRHLTPAQRRRALRKERRSWRRMADAGVYEWQADIDEEVT